MHLCVDIYSTAPSLPWHTHTHLSYVQVSNAFQGGDHASCSRPHVRLSIFHFDSSSTTNTTSTHVAMCSFVVSTTAFRCDDEGEFVLTWRMRKVSVRGTYRLQCVDDDAHH